MVARDTFDINVNFVHRYQVPTLLNYMPMSKCSKYEVQKFADQDIGGSFYGIPAYSANISTFLLLLFNFIITNTIYYSSFYSWLTNRAVEWPLKRSKIMFQQIHVVTD
jgi:hypothetical protein